MVSGSHSTTRDSAERTDISLEKSTCEVVAGDRGSLRIRSICPERDPFVLFQPEQRLGFAVENEVGPFVVV
jgi:hypothetical protein